MRCEELDTISLAQVTERIVRRDDLAIARRQCTELGLGFGEQGVDLLQVSLAVAFVVSLVGRIGGYQRVRAHSASDTAVAEVLARFPVALVELVS